MTVAVVAAVIALAGSIGVIVWLAYRVVRAIEAERDARILVADTEAELQQAQFELTQTQRALTASQRREAILDESIAEAINADPNPDLRRDDVTSRVRRLAAEWARHDAENGARPVSTTAVPASGTTAAPVATALPGPGTVSR